MSDKELSEALIEGQDAEIGLSLRVMIKVAKACKSPKEFLAAMENKDIPAIKLSDAEMNVLKGGGRTTSFLLQTAIKYGKNGVGQHVVQQGGRLFTFSSQQIKGGFAIAAGAVDDFSKGGVKATVVRNIGELGSWITKRSGF